MHRQSIFHLAILALVLVTFTSISACESAPDAQPTLDDLFTRQEVRIPMRDGVKLFTVVLTPKNATENPLPFLLSRTPYGTAGWGGTSRILYGFQELIKEGYIFVFQDIRGRYDSEGTFVMNRPPCLGAEEGGLERCIDEASDTYDSVDWLLENIPDNNGRVGQLGISYPGYLVNATAFAPHPAIKALSPQATMGDAWMGDDFFHQGAFRLAYGTEYAWQMEASSDGSIDPAPGRYDTYDWYRSFPTLSDMADAIGADAWPTWRRFVEHPTYDAEWRGRSLPLNLTKAPVPTLTVGGWWDQEDIWGPPHTYSAMEANDADGLNYIVMGPWKHGQWFSNSGDSLGLVQFGSATSDYYRKNIEAHWFAFWLKDKGNGDFPEARLFDSGSREWETFDSWPPKDAVKRRLYFRENGLLSFDAPTGKGGADSFVSDPAHPVPYRHRPIERTYDPRGSGWGPWMTEDQRFVDGRPDVLVWQTSPLDEPFTVTGAIMAHLQAATTGSDADWVVKLIDVYPDSIAARPWLGGYELMITGEIMRGRYYKSWETPTPIPANTPTAFTVDMHRQVYTFEPGHRIMVQLQSTWFPIHDRNPQTFVPNIFHAKASDYRSQTHRIYRTPKLASYVEVDTVEE